MLKRSALYLCALLMLCAGLSLMIGCGDDGTGPGDGCANCEHWTQLTTDGGEFPAIHPSRPGVIAFSSRRANPESEDADIWVREDVGGAITYYRITSDAGDERWPSWSPDGTRLSFSRFADGRGDIWVVNASTFSNPTDLEKVTAPTLVGGFPGRSVWRDNQTLIFTNGDDIYELSFALGRSASLIELIPDPSDLILGLGVQFEENQPDFVVAEEGQEKLAFISKGRGPQGNIAVRAYAESGEEVATVISINQKALLNPDRDTLRTPFNVFGITPGEYVVTVTATNNQDGLCDTTLSTMIVVQANEEKDADFLFERPRGAVRVLAPLGISARIGIMNESGASVDYGSVQAETTLIDCLFEGDYVVQLLGAGEVRDTSRVFICGRQISQACLSTAPGGCDDSLTMACIDTLVYVPPVDDDAAAKYASDGIRSGMAPPIFQSPAVDGADLWVYDLAEETFRRLTNDNAEQNYPAWSPDARYIAVIQVATGVRTLQIINVETLATREVPLPGRRTTTICNRAVAHPRWVSTNAIAVALSNCDDEIETGETNNVWVVDVGTFLP